MVTFFLLLSSRGMCRVGLAGQQTTALWLPGKPGSSGPLCAWGPGPTPGSQLRTWLPAEARTALVLAPHPAFLSPSPPIKQPPPCSLVSYKFFQHCLLSVIVCALKCMTSFMVLWQNVSVMFFPPPLIMASHLVAWLCVCHNCHKGLLCPGVCNTPTLLPKRQEEARGL